MNFGVVLERILEGVENGGIRCALIGGFTLGALGAPRATVDLDFLVRRYDLDALRRLMESLGYRLWFSTEDVSQYTHPDQVWGSVDFLHAFRTISLAMLERAVERPVLGGRRRVRVLQPEDVIGLKVQALVNDPDRRAKETADIEALLEVHGAVADWSRLEEYFALFGLQAECRRLRERFFHA